MLVSEPTNFISHGLLRSLCLWIPISVDVGSVRLVCRLGVLEVLQKEHKRIFWWSRYIRRQKRDFFPCVVVPSIRTVCFSFSTVSPIHQHPVTLFQFLEILSSRGPAACTLFPPLDQMLNWEAMGNSLQEQHAQKRSGEGAQCSIQIR